MDKKYIFKEGELTFIITELSKLPYNQVCRIINYIDHIASKQVQVEEKPMEAQIDIGIANSQKQ